MALVGFGVRHKSERTTAAQNRRDANVAARNCSGECVARFVNSHSAPLVGVIANFVRQAHVGDELCLNYVFDRHCPPTMTQRNDQCLIENSLDANGGITSGQVGDRLGGDGGRVRLLVQVVLGNLDAIRVRRKVKVDDSIEATWAQQRRIEVGGAVGGGDEQHVCGGGLRTRNGSAFWQQRVHAVDPLALHFLPSGGQVEALHLNQ